MISPGTSISEGQPVMELETDKAVIEVPSSVSGTIKEVRVKEGDKLKVGQVIFTVDNGASGVGRTASAPAPEEKEKLSTPAQRPPETQAETPPTYDIQAQSESAPPAAQPQSVAESRPAEVAPQRSATAGAALEFKLPELGENIDQGDLVRLMVSPGVKVSGGQ